MKKAALLIGVSQYPANHFPSLPAAVNDARALGNVLRHPEMGGFPASHVTLLENPGRVEMELAIEQLFSERNKDDLALLYFSGHGIKDETGALYLATGETLRHPNGELARATAIAASSVRDNMTRSRARRQIIILDSCYSGAFPAGLAIKDDGNVDLEGQLIPAASTPSGAEGQAILTASTSTRYAFGEDDQDLSLYTRFLIRGIETGEADGHDNGFVTVGDLHEYACRKVQEEQPAMQPGIYLGGRGGAIRVAGVPIGDPKERYAKKVEKALDDRGEIAIAARPMLDDWRQKLGLDMADYEAIETGILVIHRQAFQDKCRQYTDTLREILKAGKTLESERAHLDDRSRQLGLMEEDAREIRTRIEQEVAAERERREKNQLLYTGSYREAIRLEGASLSDMTRVGLVRFQKELVLSDDEVADIQAKVRREEKKPSKFKKWDIVSLLGIPTALLGFIGGVLALISVVPDWHWWKPDTPAPTSTPVTSRAAAEHSKPAEPPSVAPIAKPTPVIPPKPAKLRVTAEPLDATVTLDGRSIHSPHTVKAGEYTVRISKPGHQPFEQRVTLSAGEERTLQIALTPKPARLIVRSNVSGDIVTINGDRVGPTGPEPHKRPAGQYTVRVEKEGYEPFETEILLARDEQKTLFANLVSKVPVAGQILQDRLKDGTLGPRMVVIPAGEFQMGSPKDEKGRRPNEGPQHRVRIAKAFALGVTEVTFAEYDRFAKATKRNLPDDEDWGRGQRPVINVSWQDAVAYAQWLSDQTGERYRLPTEAEWEYAARATTTTPFSTGECITTAQANYDGNVDYAGCGAKTGIYREETVPAGSLPANPWGLHEMHGNVWEWTADCWHDNYKGAPTDGRAWGKESGGNCSGRVLRGGSWSNEPGGLRSAYRSWFNPVGAFFLVGFRLARAF
uniref:Formylglycine-generating enzyme, required for sulfatase activity, contains SUMF1/FGE domain n=1 Tax=Candidatus Kentrum sp. MB TaxID=2138164 RepID=A0A451B9C8_9GAMM|nr:MAG: Formylglycine-generating enzyme, required for sulfatase activity, contains SUMF1/FGE domain [Candidatus Kentron sp. MB]VFK29738.1 MAG: Formylglycine-generating enzyme, required for sulfatase activity, contains SUMF1/FGE domain [Candidatus Kentron sp. MB]VFK74890.1 MAG: Formylglycine-generating enzyme, required for sulfatase activity, contains SUMF1/FGE domain [Candidatus Kentron sp. MB]